MIMNSSLKWFTDESAFNFILCQGNCQRVKSVVIYLFKFNNRNIEKI